MRSHSGWLDPLPTTKPILLSFQPLWPQKTRLRLVQLQHQGCTYCKRGSLLLPLPRNVQVLVSRQYCSTVVRIAPLLPVAGFCLAVRFRILREVASRSRAKLEKILQRNSKVSLGSEEGRSLLQFGTKKRRWYTVYCFAALLLLRRQIGRAPCGFSLSLPPLYLPKSCATLLYNINTMFPFVEF